MTDWESGVLPDGQHYWIRLNRFSRTGDPPLVQWTFVSQYDQPGSASLSLLILTVCEISNLGQDLTIFCFEFCQGLQCNEVKRIIFFRTMFKLPSPKFDIGGPEFRPKPLDPAERATWDRADDEEMKLLKLALWNHEPARRLKNWRISGCPW